MDDNIKKLAESILTDITSDVSIANILLKAKVFATKSHDQEFLDWITCELSGYKDNPPEYRIIEAGVKVDVHRGFQDSLGFMYPVDMIKDEKIQKRLSHIPIFYSITEIEEMSKNGDSNNIQVDIPTAIWYHHMRHCIYGDIQRAYQFGSIASIRNIIVSVKSLLIDYFLKISDDEDIQFSSLIKKDSNIIVNNNLTASIINTGDGTINAENVSTIIGDNNILDAQTTNNLHEILKKIDDILKPVNCDEYIEVSTDLTVELNKDAPSKKVLKRCFQAIGGIVSGIMSGVIANQVTPYVSAALALL